MNKPVSDDSMKTFKNLGLDQFENLALVSVKIGGVDCDAVAVIYTEEDDSVLINPVLIIVSDDVFGIMEGPEDSEPIE